MAVAMVVAAVMAMVVVMVVVIVTRSGHSVYMTPAGCRVSSGTTESAADHINPNPDSRGWATHSLTCRHRHHNRHRETHQHTHQWHKTAIGVTSDTTISHHAHSPHHCPEKYTLKHITAQNLRTNHSRHRGGHANDSYNTYRASPHSEGRVTNAQVRSDQTIRSFAFWHATFR